MENSLATRPVKGLGNRLSLWISSRSKRAKFFRLSQRNIYIFPSRAGFAFILMLLVMLLTAINYQSSMVYLMTFLLGAVLFISIWMSFFNIQGLEVEGLEHEGVYSGENTEFIVRFSHPQRNAYGLLASVDANFPAVLEVQANERLDLRLTARACKRGMAKIERLRISSGFPFGLITAWTWLRLDALTPVYPKPTEPPDQSVGSDENEEAEQKQRGQQPDLLRPYRPGDNLARMHWKKYASSEQLVVREPEMLGSQGVWLRWEDYEHHGVELALSYLCFRVRSLSDIQQVFGLELPGHSVQPSSGELHRNACLKALALFKAEGSREQLV